MKITKAKILSAGIIIAVLAVAFFWGGDYSREETPDITAPSEEISAGGISAQSTAPPAVTEQPTTPASETIDATKPTEAAEPTSEAAIPSTSAEVDETPSAPATEASAIATTNPETGKDKYLTDPVPEGKPTPVEPQDAVVSDKAYTCTLSVRCDTILDNMSALNPNKAELVPEDGVILASIQVVFYEGESVFNVLQREMKRNKIHMEFMNTPIYNSAYIEGINNLYEFDCGELSGWMYKVNGWFPNYGSSRFQLSDGDVVEWIFTCDLGRDVGDNSMTGQRDE